MEEQQHVPGLAVPLGGYPTVVGIPPPPPPPPMLVPHQVRMRPPIRHRKSKFAPEIMYGIFNLIFCKSSLNLPATF